MGHSIRAVLGKADVIDTFSSAWILAESKTLNQGFALSLIPDQLLDDIDELVESRLTISFEQFNFLTASLHEILIDQSFRAKIAYIETDYFGGIGTQAAVLYENGQIQKGPLFSEIVWDRVESQYLKKPDGIEAINQVLQNMGVWCKDGRDEFDMLGLPNYRSM